MARRNIILTVLAGLTSALTFVGIKKTFFDGRHEYKFFDSPMRIEFEGKKVHIIPRLVVIEKPEEKSAHFPPFLSTEILILKDAVLRTIQKFEKQIVMLKHRGEDEQYFDHNGLHALLTGSIKKELMNFETLEFFLRVQYVECEEDAA